MAGYSLLPTVDNPTSTLTFRLSNEEKAERDEWMRGAHARKMPIPEIAYEVGLSVPRVYQILKAAPKREKKPLVIPVKQKQTDNGIGCGVVQYRLCGYKHCGRTVETECYDKYCRDSRTNYGLGCISIPNYYCSNSCWSLSLMEEI